MAWLLQVVDTSKRPDGSLSGEKLILHRYFQRKRNAERYAKVYRGFSYLRVTIRKAPGHHFPRDYSDHPTSDLRRE